MSLDIASLIVGLVTGVITTYTFHRKIQVENILQERTKWRERIRELASRIATNPKPKDIAELEIRLNPLDVYDKKIVFLAKRLQESNKCKNEFLHSVALLLKHDWERAKNETSCLGFFTDINKNYFTTRKCEYKGQLLKRIKFIFSYKLKWIRIIPIILFVICFICFVSDIKELFCTLFLGKDNSITNFLIQSNFFNNAK